MWFIRHKYSDKKYYLVPERDWCIGRAGSDIVLKGDTSVSRSHAIIRVVGEKLLLQDSESRYGTYYNDGIETKTKLQTGNIVNLKEGDRILFGALQNEWEVSRHNILTVVSSLAENQISEITKCLKPLGGKVISKWRSDCTHLTMSEITITIKVLNALIDNIPIVSCNYWKDYLKILQNTKEPPKENLYLPKSSASVSSAVDVSKFACNDKRKTLFSGKTFVFMSKKHCDMYSDIVVKAGGTCRDLKSNIPKSHLLRPNVAVIQYMASTQSQGTQTINTISEYLEANSLRTIPEYEIGLAIVCCTTEKFCNPSYSPVMNILPQSVAPSPNIGTILAQNTSFQDSQANTVPFLGIEIPDTDDVAPAKQGSEVYEAPSEVIEIPDSPKVQSNSDVIVSDGLQEKKRKREDVEEESNAKKIMLSSDIDNETCSSRLFSTKFSNKHREIIEINNQNIDHVLSTSKPFTAKIPDNRQEDIEVSDRQVALNTRDTKSVSTDKTNKNSKKRKINLDVDNAHPSKAKRLASPVEACTTSNAVSKESRINVHPIAEKDMNMNTPPTASDKPSSQGVSRFSGFLQKSQRARPSPVADKSIMTPQRAKRGRIALITNDDSENEDDLFNFGSSPKKSRLTSQREELFDFGDRETQDMPSSVKNTEHFPKQQITPKAKPIKLEIKVSPLKISPDRWISKTDPLNIKAEKPDGIKKDTTCEDPTRYEWVDSIKFQVRVLKMQLSSKGDKSCNSENSSNSTKNFKAFVKKQNYKPQTRIIATRPIFSVH